VGAETALGSTTAGAQSSEPSGYHATSRPCLDRVAGFPSGSSSTRRPATRKSASAIAERESRECNHRTPRRVAEPDEQK
jgi:hypothetical protein